MARSIFAVASDHLACLAQLRAAGFRADEISWLATNVTDFDEQKQVHVNGIQLTASADTASPPGKGTSIGSAWLPVVGTILASGPLALMLTGSQSIIKILSELGVPAYAVLRYEDALARGAAVVAVHTDNGFEVETVSQLLRDGGCEQVAAA